MSNKVVATRINEFVRVLVLTSKLTSIELAIHVGLEAGNPTLEIQGAYCIACTPWGSRWKRLVEATVLTLVLYEEYLMC